MSHYRKVAREGNYEGEAGPDGRGIPRRKCGAKADRINLGLALLSRRAAGVPLIFDDIAAWCGCSEQAIVAIFQKAMRKVRAALRRPGLTTDGADKHGYSDREVLREGLEFFNERGREVARARARKEAA